MNQQKRTDTGTPTLSWCIIARNCEDTFEATLKSIRERTPQAEIVVVDTCSSDSTPEIAQRYADVYEVYKGPRGDWDTEMPYFDDAAAARQHSFELASGVWRGWIDADDVLPGPEEVERLLRLNGRWQPDLGQRETIEASAEPLSLEDMLVKVDEEHPGDVTCIHAPYLYQRDENDRALVWQTRERIVKWSGNWKWMEKSHEILCPVDATFGTRLDFSALLFVHEKVHDAKANDYAQQRHFDVLLKQYDEGDITTRRCIYLAQYAKQLAPSREAEFIDAAYRSSATTLDRYRSRIAEAEYYIARGLYRDSRESLAAAVDLAPSLPDAWLVGANAAVIAEDWYRAKTWLQNAINLRVTAESLIIPRQLEVMYPTLLAAVDEKLASLCLKAKNVDGAAELYDHAEGLLVGVIQNEAIGPDREQTLAMYRKILNAKHGNAIACRIAEQAKYLVDNDEPAKVLSLLESAPHTIEDHPVIIELEKWSKRLRTHLEDDAAYKKFYLDSEDHGIQVASPEHLVSSKSQASRDWLPRAYWAAEIIARECPNGTILDLGCYDGLTALPILELCPNIKYVGVDINEAASQRLRDRFEKAGFSDRAEVLVNAHASPGRFLEQLVEERGRFDLAMWFEVIEHVPDPEAYVFSLTESVKEGSRVLISTPWGSFDDGYPANAESRDERGHVRAMTARNFYDMMVKKCGVDVEQLYCHEMVAKNGADVLHASISEGPSWRDEKPVAFAVASALWDWNSTTVHRGGFGASEETICYLAEKLVDTMRVDVFGPVPQEEVQGGVGYWPHSQLRHIDEDAIVVVSRAPSWGAEVVDELAGFSARNKVLWLQDAAYGDLNAEVASKYAKIVCVGEWQKQRMHDYHGVPLEHMEVIGNFLLPEHFLIDDKPVREPHHFIYASSPDRGLINLLRLWPRILEMYPDATLDVFYGWRGMNKLGSGVLGGDAWVSRFEKTRREYELLRHQQGVTERGMVSHAQIAREFMRASAWVYPTIFTETFCSNAVKSRAAGCVPVTTGLAALNETAVCDQAQIIPFDEAAGCFSSTYDDEWLAGLKVAVETSEEERIKMSNKAIADYSVGVMAARWRDLLRSLS